MALSVFQYPGNAFSEVFAAVGFSEIPGGAVLHHIRWSGYIERDHRTSTGLRLRSRLRQVVLAGGHHRHIRRALEQREGGIVMQVAHPVQRQTKLRRMLRRALTKDDAVHVGNAPRNLSEGRLQQIPALSGVAPAANGSEQDKTRLLRQPEHVPSQVLGQGLECVGIQRIRNHSYGPIVHERTLSGAVRQPTAGGCDMERPLPSLSFATPNPAVYVQAAMTRTPVVLFIALPPAGTITIRSIMLRTKERPNVMQRPDHGLGDAPNVLYRQHLTAHPVEISHVCSADVEPRPHLRG